MKTKFLSALLWVGLPFSAATAQPAAVPSSPIQSSTAPQLVQVDYSIQVNEPFQYQSKGRQLLEVGKTFTLIEPLKKNQRQLIKTEITITAENNQLKHYKADLSIQSLGKQGWQVISAPSLITVAGAAAQMSVGKSQQAPQAVKVSVTIHPIRP